jgi:hypothetical protein
MGSSIGEGLLRRWRLKSKQELVYMDELGSNGEPLKVYSRDVI